jgi:DNA polymerase III subunit gamma/tau
VHFKKFVLFLGAIKIKLAEKYRPTKFEDVIGQDSVMCVLKASVKQNRYGSAYLFCGPFGDGKTTLARIFAKAVLCESPIDGEPCCECESCQLFEEERHFSYREIDAASYGGKDDMVSLRDDASSLAVSKKKIICIDESHDISKQGQDALLKQTEECPDHLIYEFCTTDPDKMSSTLRDRFMEFHVVKVSAELISQRLRTICEREGIVYQEDALQVIAERSEGHVRSAINLVEEIAYLGEISLENLNKVSKDFEEHLFTIVSNLGISLPKIIETYQSISSFLSPFEFYNLLLSLLSDATKFLFGYDGFSEKRKDLLSKLKEIHGYSLAEFLNYLITRDKFVEKVGLQSDLIILHYKFCANNFAPRIQKEPSTNSQIQTVSKSDPSNSPFSYAELSKLSIKDRNQLLREERKKHQKTGEKEKSEIVPTKWPLPKEERPGNNFEEKSMSAKEFSQKLVGGRVGEVRSVVDSRTG